MPKANQSRHRQKAKPQRQQTHRRLGGDQEPAPIEMVGGGAGPGQQEELGRKLQRHDHAQGGGALVRQDRQHQPILRRPLHAGADIGDERAARPNTIVVAPQRPKSPRSRDAHAKFGPRPSFKLPKWRALNRPINSMPRPRAAICAGS